MKTRFKWIGSNQWKYLSDPSRYTMDQLLAWLCAVAKRIGRQTEHLAGADG